MYYNKFSNDAITSYIVVLFHFYIYDVEQNDSTYIPKPLE